jgi:FkbM family methyltransferase
MFVSYAQNFEDVMLYRVFRGSNTGFYVDVGAADPVNLSVTKCFYDLGWSGINIEPHPELYKRLVAQRPRDTNLNCGAGDRRGEAVYFELPTMEWSSFDPAVRERAIARGEAVTERTIPVLSLHEILARHSRDRTINFLKIDVEGWELQVLKGLDLRRYRPIVIVIEATLQGTTEAAHSVWENILVTGDYQPVYFDGVNRFYLQCEKIYLKEHFSVPPNTFDEFVTADVKNLESNLATLTKLLKESEADRAARLEQINTLTKLLKESEADRAARLAQINTLTKLLKESEADRASCLEQINTLNKLLKGAEKTSRS